MTETAKDLLKKDVEAAWTSEIERRVAELEAHSVEIVPWSKVRARLFHGFE